MFGGLASRACATIKFGARRPGDKKRGRDGTKYSRFHKRNYLSHHLAAIVSAVVLTDASNIEDGISARPQAAGDGACARRQRVDMPECMCDRPR